MSNDVLDQVADWYSDSLQQHGTQASGVGWTDAQKHELRFDKLYELVKEDDNFSVNDLGCGYGALFSYLQRRQKSVSLYRGYEISEPMLDAARKLLPMENISLVHASEIDETADYGFASGIFNVKFGEDEVRWLKYIETTLHNLNAFCQKGFAFNLLTSYVDWKAADLYYADPCYFFDFCKSNFSGKIALFHDYDLWEWTMVVRKSGGDTG